MSATTRGTYRGRLTEGRSWVGDEGDGEGESKGVEWDMASDEGSMKDDDGTIWMLVEGKKGLLHLERRRTNLHTWR